MATSYGTVALATVLASGALTLNLAMWTQERIGGFVPHSTFWLAIIALNFIFMISLSIGISSILRRLAELRKGVAAVSFFSLAPFCLMVYWFFSVAHTFAQHAAASVPLNKIVPTILIYYMKLTLALGMYRYADGTFAKLYSSIAENKVVVLKYSMSAACMAFYDLLSFVSLARLSPAKYQVLLHLRTVLIAFFWQFVMSKRLSRIQWAALMLCIWAAMLTERRVITEIFQSDSDLATTLYPYATLVVQYALAIVGNLSNEKLLNEVQLPVNAQNILMYSLGSVILTTSLGLGSLFSGTSLLPFEDFPLVLEHSVLWSILTLSLLGISAGYVLKTSGNIFKELAGMGVTFTTACFDWLVLGNPFNVIDIQAVVSMAFGLGFFSLLHIVEGFHPAGAAHPSKEEDAPPFASPNVLAKWLRLLVVLVAALGILAAFAGFVKNNVVALASDKWIASKGG